MLMEATHVDTCPEKDKLVVLLIDEMYVREGIVYKKHSERMIGFSNLRDINSHLSQFEQGLHNSSKSMPNAVLAKTMVVFMVHGLLNKLQFPYAQFPCSQLTGDHLYDLF